MSDQSSNFSFYSIGIVVKDIVPGQDTITVSPIEHLNVQKDQPLDSSSVTNQGNLDSPINSNSFNTEIKSSGNITAKWINLGGSNRITAPDVYKGETVIIYKYENVDEYYWSTVFREPTLRKQETVVTAYSNEKAPMKEFNPDSSYWTMFDTRGKKVQLHTSKNDGEYTTYDSIIDTKEGIFTLAIDGNGNFVKMISKQNLLELLGIKEVYIHDGGGEHLKLTKDGSLAELVAGSTIKITSGNIIIENCVTKKISNINTNETIDNKNSNIKQYTSNIINKTSTINTETKTVQDKNTTISNNTSKITTESETVGSRTSNVDNDTETIGSRTSKITTENKTVDNYTMSANSSTINGTSYNSNIDNRTIKGKTLVISVETITINATNVVFNSNVRINGTLTYS